MKSQAIELGRIKSMLTAISGPISQISLPEEESKRGWEIKLPGEHNPEGLNLSVVSPLLYDSLRIFFTPFYTAIHPYTKDLLRIINAAKDSPGELTLENLDISLEEASLLGEALLIIAIKLPDNVIKDFEDDTWHSFRALHRNAVEAQLAIEGYGTENEPPLITALEHFMNLAEEISLKQEN